MSQHFFSFETAGLYDEATHGARTMLVVAEGWERPRVDVTLQPGDVYGEGPDRIVNETEHAIIIKNAPDMTVEPPMVEVPNPRCGIPADAVAISVELRAQLLAAQSTGKRIVKGDDGLPEAQDPPIEERQATAWEQIKAERDRRTLVGGYKVGAHWFHSDTFSRTQQIGLVMLDVNLPAGVQWKTMDGSFVPMTPALARQVFAAAAASDIAIFAAAEAHKAAMLASVQPEAYDFSVGWPEAFAPA